MSIQPQSFRTSLRGHEKRTDNHSPLRLVAGLDHAPPVGNRNPVSARTSEVESRLPVAVDSTAMKNLMAYFRILIEWDAPLSMKTAEREAA